MVTSVADEQLAALSQAPAVRRSRIAYVVGKLRIAGYDYLLLNAHRKWGDWSLPGGHVEPSDADFWAAAVRETREELEPLRYGEEVEVQREPLASSEWGPVASQSAGGAPTLYQAAFYGLRFMTNPKASLARLPEGDFRLVRVRDIPSSQGLSDVVKRLGDLLPGGWASIPMAWNEELGDVPLRSSGALRPRPGG